MGLRLLLKIPFFPLKGFIKGLSLQGFSKGLRVACSFLSRFLSGFSNPKAQNGPKALYSMVFGPKSLNI